MPASRVQEPGVAVNAIESLRRDGIAIVPFRELFGGTELWEDLAADMERFVRKTEAKLDEPRERQKGKSFIVRRYLLGKGDDRYGLDNPWLRLSLSEPLLGVVNAYRGEPTRLIDFDNWYTVPNPDADTRMKSQRWHRDPWDEHIVKVFVYFSDVDQDAGPFEYVPDSAPGGRFGHLWPWQPEGVYPPDDEFEQSIPASAWLMATGPAGTVVFCDTSGFHRGGWARTKPRVLAVQSYVGSASEKRRRFGLHSSATGAELSPAALTALSERL